ncbi:hypothetical protein BX264_3417 [Streptomyces sp. 2333.5]|uniref:hypothetical protein n=1 Tax=Streptomyces TaxID=1883 RepID=UPI000A59A250|nr:MULTISPECIES: hypothetical protein [unclassified Streptomyces]PJJ03049.1 hypothetical protein BX264_3417 [Streptomyces sp. 2333.5]
MATRCGLLTWDCPPPEAEVQWVYQPVEVQYPDGGWALGRINAWWTDGAGELWCRLRTLPGGACPQWLRYDPESILLLPSTGL